MSHPPTSRASAAIIQNDHLLVIKRYFQNHHYTVIPGGKVEEGETPEEAAIRETLEEVGVAITLGELLCTYENDQNGLTEYVYAATLLPNQPEPTWSELEKVTEDNTYETGWMSFAEISNSTLVPDMLKSALIETFS